ncbi:hypothetical protein BGX34_008190 [Mortierella sp. NVP85]|nr:hypothetical protein BGX34_008190 [Mortierella sp. NVP85]
MGHKKFGRLYVVLCCLAFASLLLVLYYAAPSRQGADEAPQSMIPSKQGPLITSPAITYKPVASQSKGHGVIPANTQYFTQEFAIYGLGHKWCELMMGVRFARLNNLTYVFNEKTFLHNVRNTDLTWVSDLLKRRYGSPSDLNPAEWILTPDYMYDAAVLYQETMKKSNKAFKGFYSSGRTDCQNPDTGSHGCWLIGYSYFNASRDLQDLLSHPDKKDAAVPKEQENQDPTDAIVDRVAIHIRLGDITNMLSPESYRDLVRGIEILHQVTIPPENVNFVYYEASSYDRHNEDDSAVTALKQIMPNAQYNNLESTADTIKFLAHSKYLVTSGSSLSFMSAYLCADCHVVFVKPKEYNDDPFDESNYNSNFYYMSEWIPHFRYLALANAEH